MHLENQNDKYSLCVKKILVVIDFFLQLWNIHLIQKSCVSIIYFFPYDLLLHVF
jgi:hypothetical protein